MIDASILSAIIDFFNFYGFTREKVTPLFIMGLIIYCLIARKLKPLDKLSQKITHALVEIQALLRNCGFVIQQEIVQDYAQSESPLVLRSEYRPLVDKSGLATQIEEKLPQLLSWLKRQKPKTGIDAQDKISYLVVSGKIEDFLDLADYKQYLYEKGKTARDAMGILVVYLFEVLIPKLKLRKFK